ncbi:hypothetical protein N431DRAFT_400960 [Stipitochalara longipes BDJ]|nr:hypothetical protein N431DRAFT_400960 [Stipitochalara longipes BDJ]
MLANYQLLSPGKNMQRSQLASRCGSQSSHAPNAIDPSTSKRRKRASKPKSKTGCSTCKIRRVKCDESRPHCKRCIKFGMTCDGYPTDSTSFTPVRRRRIRKSVVGIELYIPPTWCMLSTGRFSSDQESRFFTLYMQETASQISGPFQTSLWACLIPQACEAEPFLRQLVIATAALSYAYTEEFSASEHGELWATSKRSTYSYALNQYDKALQGMRDAILKGRYNLRNALLACLLVFCFESLHGDTKSTASQAASGLALLQEWMAKHTFTKAIAVPRGGQFEGLDMEILHAFVSLDAQVLFFMSAPSAKQQSRFLEQFSHAVKTQMPHKFQTLEVVKAYWFLVQRRNYHFEIMARDELKIPYTGLNSRLEKTSKQFSIDSLHRAFVPRTHESSSSALKAQMESCREDIRRWSRSAASIFTEVENKGTQEDKVLMQLLNIQAYFSHIQLAAIFFTSEIDYDIFLSTFTAIVELSEVVHPYLSTVLDTDSGERKAASRLFRFHSGIVYPLSFTVTHCRDSNIRNRASALLKKSLLCEGLWNSFSVGCLATCIQKVEEEGMDSSGFIPEDKRVVLSLWEVDPKTRSARLEFMSKGSNGQRLFRTEMIEWKFGIEH